MNFLCRLRSTILAETEGWFGETLPVKSTPQYVDASKLKALNLRISKTFFSSSCTDLHYAHPKNDASVLVVAKVCFDLVHPEQENLESDEYSVLTLQKEVYDAWQREVNILAECSKSCAFIVRLLASERVFTLGVIYMEFCTLGSLNKLCRKEPIREDILLSVVYCVLKGLEHIHDLGYVHGDIKPSNFLLSDNGIVKICDFGAAEKASEYATVARRVSFGLWTEGYVAPEVPTEGTIYPKGQIIMDNIAVGSEEYATMVKKRDIYALGVSISVMYLGKGEKNPEPEIRDCTNPSLLELFNGCVAEDFHWRLTAKAALEHELMKDMELNDQYACILKDLVCSKRKEFKRTQQNVWNMISIDFLTEYDYADKKMKYF